MHYLRENILFSLAKKVVVMADKTKFVKNFTRTVPVEIHPLARNSVTKSIKKLGGEAQIRSLDRGYPFFTENGNIILDCNFGTIKNPKILTQQIKQTPRCFRVRNISEKTRCYLQSQRKRQIRYSYRN